jgi:hypothetical protein
MVDPPRLHQQLGANWVEVTKAVYNRAFPFGSQRLVILKTRPATPVKLIACDREPFGQRRVRIEELLP